MSPPAMMMELPRLFPVEDDPLTSGRSLDDAVLELLAAAAHGSCLVCGGTTEAIVGGARCHECGSELLMGAEPAEIASA